MPSDKEIKIRFPSSKVRMESINAIIEEYIRKSQFYIIDSVTDAMLGIPPKPPMKVKPKTVSRTKDWECDIPDPDPFMKPVSNPSKQVRAKLSTKRKKRK